MPRKQMMTAPAADNSKNTGSKSRQVLEGGLSLAHALFMQVPYSMVANRVGRQKKFGSWPLK